MKSNVNAELVKIEKKVKALLDLDPRDSYEVAMIEGQIDYLIEDSEPIEDRDTEETMTLTFC